MHAVVCGPQLSLAQLDEGPPAEMDLPEEAAPAEPGQESRISMDFQDVPLKQLLKIFSQQSGLNFVASEEIENRNVTLYLDNVSVEDALTAILKANRLTYVQTEGSAIFHVKALSDPDIDTETRIYRLSYATVEGVDTGDEGGASSTGIEKILEELLTENGKIVVDARTNSLIVTEIPSRFKVIENTIKELDIKTEQVLISAEILEVSVDTLNRLGIDWGSSTGQMASYSGPSRGTHFPWKESLLKGAGDPTVTMATFSMSTFTSVFKAIATDSDTHYLARPRLLTLDNTTAEIKITQDAAVATATIQVAGEGMTQATESAERYEVGTSLKVTPHINKEGYVTMTIEPEVSRVKAAAISGYYDPHTRYAKTRVMVKNGDTVVIAGLISREDTLEKRKVPFLGDVPILGMPFRRNTDEKKDTEIIIFITPQIIIDETDVAKNMGDGFCIEGLASKACGRDLSSLQEARKATLDVIAREQESPLSARELAIGTEMVGMEGRMPQ